MLKNLNVSSLERGFTELIEDVKPETNIDEFIGLIGNKLNVSSVKLELVHRGEVMDRSLNMNHYTSNTTQASFYLAESRVHKAQKAQPDAIDIINLTNQLQFVFKSRSKRHYVKQNYFKFILFIDYKLKFRIF